MSKPKQMDVIGWYQPHIAVNWTGEILDPKTGELVKEPSMTKQSFKEECDINNIVRRFEATGIIDHINQAHAQGYYQDLPSGLDLQMGLDMIAQADRAFMSLPADIRAKFDNDAVAFVSYVHDPANQQQLIDWGLAKDTRPPPPPEPPKAPEPAKT
ncbi:internal scaffolding protein [Blackfly microvirus SF02]|uniref:Internal scaffolding protein n=1 Tax=Blackfly microvirus SF02 TaxID=2576452 RepID=A0A4P8PK97_9VIRU|nr:internal scaffolding protein [Blackfly microvirus SF02]